MQKSLTQSVEEVSQKTGQVNHLAVIMDGNRRWAKNKGLPSFAGHREGVESLKAIVKSCSQRNIKYLTVYVFSTENWQRETDEVNFLFDLLKRVLAGELKALIDQGVRLRFIGDLEGLNHELRYQLLEAEKATASNTEVNLQIALNYGGRLEILKAVQKIAEDVQSAKIAPSELNEDLFASYLFTKGIPDPDLLIRTGGESRISNYLLWQIAYSEIIVTQTLWPDFRDEDLKLCLEEFSKRSRRFGK